MINILFNPGSLFNFYVNSINAQTIIGKYNTKMIPIINRIFLKITLFVKYAKIQNIPKNNSNKGT